MMRHFTMKFNQYINERQPISIPGYSSIGLELHPKDTPPEIVNGNYILYHGTTAKTAKTIITNRLLKQTKGWGIGITTTYRDAEPYALMKSLDIKDRKVVLRIEVDKEWLDAQEIHREIGGRGVNQFLIQGDIPSGAIKSIRALKQNEITKLFK